MTKITIQTIIVNRRKTHGWKSADSVCTFGINSEEKSFTE